MRCQRPKPGRWGQPGQLILAIALKRIAAPIEAGMKCQAFRCAQRALRPMLKARAGHIVNIGSFSWSPTGDTIAFVANLNSDPGLHIDQEQIWTVSATPTDEPYGQDDFMQVTSGGGQISSLAYSPEFSSRSAT